MHIFDGDFSKKNLLRLSSLVLVHVVVLLPNFHGSNKSCKHSNLHESHLL